ncbi:MAG: glycosyltransferase family 39 protein [Thermoleophilaceae bacterium]|nr:glycosyltransferase family 39 protein [Thermoleophilaceae bacterium]
MRKLARAVAWIGLLTAALWLVYGRGTVGYDAAYALLWGDQLASWSKPVLASTFAPTPHPLAILVGASLSIFGSHADEVLTLLQLVLLAVLGGLAFRLGRELFSAAVGAVFALLLLTLPAFVNSTQLALIDVPFLALVIAAAIHIVGSRPRPHLALALLLAAGLLRPEAWALSLAYGGYLLYQSQATSTRAKTVLLMTAAPLAWVGFDLAATGDPFFSLHGTRHLAAELDRYRDPGTAASAGPAFLRVLLGQTLLIGGLVGLVMTVALQRQKTFPVAGALAVGLLSFVALGAAGLPLVARYIVVPAAILCLYAAILLAAWPALPRRSAARVAWTACAAGFATALLIGVSQQRREIHAVAVNVESVQRTLSDLERLTQQLPQGKQLIGCGPIVVDDFRIVPHLGLWLGLGPEAFAIVSAQDQPPLGSRLTIDRIRPATSGAIEEAKTGHRNSEARFESPRHMWRVRSKCPSVRVD